MIPGATKQEEILIQLKLPCNPVESCHYSESSDYKWLQQQKGELSFKNCCHSVSRGLVCFGLYIPQRQAETMEIKEIEPVTTNSVVLFDFPEHMSISML